MEKIKKKKETIAANVVTYNRKELLIECLDALLKQTHPLDAIYIIDNASTDGTPELLKEKGYIQELPPKNLDRPIERIYYINIFDKNNEIKIHYVRMNENTGSSGGQYEGVKRGYEKGYDWLWLMDDDCLPELNCLNILINHLNKNEVGAPLKKDIKTKKVVRTCKINLNQSPNKIENYGLPFNCFLINKQIIKDVKFPYKYFFIDRDDIEYNYRIKEKGFKCYLIKKATVFHPNDTCFKLKIFNKYINIINYGNGKRIFYRIRNTIYMYKLHKQSVSLIHVLRVILKEALALFFKEFSFGRLLLFFKAIFLGIIYNVSCGDEE